MQQNRKSKRHEVHLGGNSSWLCKQMATNYADYIEDSHERVRRSRANNPEKRLERDAKRRKVAVEQQKYHCKLCDLSFTCRNWLDKHLKTAKHLRKSKKHLNPFIYEPCNVGFPNKSNLTGHEKSDRHERNLEKQKASSSLALENADGVQDTPEEPQEKINAPEEPNIPQEIITLEKSNFTGKRTFFQITPVKPKTNQTTLKKYFAN
ncbi:hypothetical protein ACJ73_03598 [Blastomyces percursus]|uniref:C2H2-type domain-containing protein n=1 Tax=Blastomyces percursus TaxID=1658174 RepID=A0A1J9R927_9EURO|nr:hypothetical protein ACJ73_03598 [Blastomyces percursus]